MPAKASVGNDIKKIIVFDLDETLGYFSEFGIFYDAVERFSGNRMTHPQSFKLIELFEKEIGRPRITTILREIALMKRRGTVDCVMIYTNNQGGPEWTYMIKDYFENRIGVGRLFDKTVCAYRAGGPGSDDNRRTTHSKTYNDLVVRCCKLPKTTQVCFVDDQLHPGMRNNANVYYLKVPPYVFSLPPQIFVERFIGSTISAQIRRLKKTSEFTNHVLKCFSRTEYYKYSPKTPDSLKVDKKIGTELLEMVRKFGSE